MLSPDRELLYNKINKRVDEMFEKGLLDEVKYLLNKYELSVTARAAIGYKEIIDALENNTSLEDAKELIKKKTRNYAKRQVTYFKHQLPCEIYSSKEELLEAIK
jgi:tRNA dimethylallyltransferase